MARDPNTPKPNRYATGAVWLEGVGENLRPYFEGLKIAIPPSEMLEFHFGFPERGKNKRDSLPFLGEVHHPDRSSNGKFCIIVSLEAKDDLQIIGIVARLLVDASVEQGPGRPKRLGEKLNRAGMIGGPRHAVPDAPTLIEKIASVLVDVGQRPSMTLTITFPEKKDTCRSLKSTCLGRLKGGLACTYLQRVTVANANLACCGVHGRETIRVELIDGRKVDLSHFPPRPENDPDEEVAAGGPPSPSPDDTGSSGAAEPANDAARISDAAD